MSDSLHDRLLAAVTARRELAQLMPPFPWRFDDDLDEVIAADDITVADVFALGSNQQRHIGRFFVANDPAQILRDTEAHLKILDEISRWKHLVVDDCWYTCSAATEEADGGENCNENKADRCDCGMQRRKNLILDALAGIYPEANES